MISDKKQKHTTSGKKTKKSKNHSLYDYHLAIKQSDNDVKHKRHLGNWDNIEVDGWHLPGTKEARYDCLQWKTEGCTNEKQHEQHGYGKTTFVKHYQKTCTRADCNKCVDHWMNRNSIKAANRISEYAKNTGLPSFHLALSPSKENQLKSESELRKTAMKILKELNVKGGALIFHPFRQVQKSNDWKESPHFHFVGFGWMRLAKEIVKKYGWVVIYLQKRKFVLGTFTYLFSHCGIKKGRHAITWIGELSYGKLNVPKRPASSKCPCCNEFLVPIYYAGTDPPFQNEENFEGFVSSSDWYEEKTGYYIS
jgi:hypothetical protein